MSTCIVLTAGVSDNRGDEDVLRSPALGGTVRRSGDIVVDKVAAERQD